MKNVFIETSNVSTFRSAIRKVEDTEKGQPGLVVAHGRAGRGKTMAALNYHAVHGGIYLRAWERWTQTAFLQALCFEVCGMRPRSANNCKRKIMEMLDKEIQTVFIDEADRLNIGRIEDLRDIHDETGAPIVIIGEEELQGLLGERRRIWSRVTQDVVFGPVIDEDVALFGLDAAGLDIEAFACQQIVKKADGDFRLVRNIIQVLEQVAIARETNLVTTSMVEDVLRQRKWGHK
ncbi:AAA family ATPase [Maridesulfovibrio bastinii]|uniref:AAA family ATPase n=1 Tax=Maridesulfovibrio bastinii TaxID=47157 RepID=UPI0003FAE2F7|nr:ATP-binding protein [Maridesulfovibrio bastinii]